MKRENEALRRHQQRAWELNRVAEEAERKRVKAQQQDLQLREAEQKADQRQKALIDRLKKIWREDPANRPGFYSIAKWDTCCPTCRKVVLNSDSLGRCLICKNARKEIGYHVEMRDIDLMLRPVFVTRCSHCNSTASAQMTCPDCDTDIDPDMIRIYEGGGHELIQDLRNYNSLWVTGWKILMPKNGLADDGKKTRLFEWEIIRQKYCIPPDYPLLARADLSTVLFVAGHKLFFLNPNNSPCSEHISTLMELSKTNPKKGWLKTSLRLGQSTLTLKNSEIDIFLSFVYIFAKKLELYSEYPAGDNLQVAYPVSPPPRKAILGSEPTVSPAFRPDTIESQYEVPEKGKTIESATMALPSSMNIVDEIPVKLLQRIRDRVKRENRSDSARQREEMEVQVEAHRSLQQILADPPVEMGNDILMKIVSKAQREDPLDIEVQVRQVEEQISGHAEIQHFADNECSSELPR